MEGRELTILSLALKTFSLTVFFIMLLLLRATPFFLRKGHMLVLAMAQTFMTIGLYSFNLYRFMVRDKYWELN
jgi:hypothetical protein